MELSGKHHPSLDIKLEISQNYSYERCLSVRGHGSRKNARTWHSRRVPKHLCISRERAQTLAAYSIHSEWRPNQYLKSLESGNFEVSPFSNYRILIPFGN